VLVLENASPSLRTSKPLMSPADAAPPQWQLLPPAYTMLPTAAAPPEMTWVPARPPPPVAPGRTGSSKVVTATPSSFARLSSKLLAPALDLPNCMPFLGSPVLEPAAAVLPAAPPPLPKPPPYPATDKDGPGAAANPHEACAHQQNHNEKSTSKIVVALGAWHLAAYSGRRRPSACLSSTAQLLLML